MRLAKKVLPFMIALAFATAVGAQPRPGGGGGGGGGPRPGGGGGGGGGEAETGTIVQFNAEQIARLFTEAGFQSKVIDNNNVHMVKTVFWTDDLFSGALPEFCNKNNECNGLQIFANLGNANVDSNWLNAWNSRYLFVRAYKEGNGSLIFQFDILLKPGVTPDYVKATATLFKLVVDQSTDFKP